MAYGCGEWKLFSARTVSRSNWSVSVPVRKVLPEMHEQVMYRAEGSRRLWFNAEEILYDAEPVNNSSIQKAHASGCSGCMGF